MAGKKSVSISLLFFIVYGSMAAWFPFLSIYLKDVGLSGMQIGTLLSIQPAFMVAVLPFWGIAADKFGRKKVLLFTLFLQSALILAVIGKGGYFYYFAVLSAFMLFYVGVPALLDSIALDTVESAESAQYSKLRMWGSIGWSVSSLLVGQIVSEDNLTPMFVISSIAGFSSFLLCWLTIKKEVKNNISSPPVNFKDIKEVLKNKKMLLFMALLLVYGIGTSSIYNFYSIYLAEIGATRERTGISFSIQAFSEIPFFFIGTMLVRRFTAGKIILAGMLLQMLRMLLYFIINDSFWALMLDTTHGLSYSLFIVGAIEYVDSEISPEWRATGMSLFWSTYFGIGMVLGNLSTGYLMEKIPIKNVFLISSFILLVTSGCAWFLFRTRNAKKFNKVVEAYA